MARPTLHNLDEALKDLVEWERFAVHLPNITVPAIDEIKKEKPNSVAEQKFSLLTKWLRVCSNASWEDVIDALGKIDENALASKVKAKFLLNCGDGAAVSTSHIMVDRAIVGTLQKLHDKFLSLESKVEESIETEVEKDRKLLMHYIRFVQRHRAYDLELQSVNDLNTFLSAVRRLYTFLDCHLFVSLARKVGGPIVTKVNQYYSQVRRFMRETAIKDLKCTLSPYHERFETKSRIKVILTLQGEWETQSMWVVKELVRNIFYLKNDGECAWFDVRPGSIVVIFTSPKQMQQNLLKVISRSKLEFLGLVGVIGLQIGSVCVIQKKEDPIFSFKEHSLKAQLVNIDAAIFFQENFECKDISNELFFRQFQSFPSYSLEVTVIDVTRYICYFANDLLHISEDLNRLAIRKSSPISHALAYVIEFSYKYVDEIVNTLCNFQLQEWQKHLKQSLIVSSLDHLEDIYENAGRSCDGEAAESMQKYSLQSSEHIENSFKRLSIKFTNASEHAILLSLKIEEAMQLKEHDLEEDLESEHDDEWESDSPNSSPEGVTFFHQFYHIANEKRLLLRQSMRQLSSAFDTSAKKQLPPVAEIKKIISHNEHHTHFLFMIPDLIKQIDYYCNDLLQTLRMCEEVVNTVKQHNDIWSIPAVHTALSDLTATAFTACDYVAKIHEVLYYFQCRFDGELDWSDYENCKTRFEKAEGCVEDCLLIYETLQNYCFYAHRECDAASVRLRVKKSNIEKIHAQVTGVVLITATGIAIYTVAGVNFGIGTIVGLAITVALTTVAVVSSRVTGAVIALKHYNSSAHRFKRLSTDFSRLKAIELTSITQEVIHQLTDHLEYHDGEATALLAKLKLHGRHAYELTSVQTSAVSRSKDSLAELLNHPYHKLHKLSFYSEAIVLYVTVMLCILLFIIMQVI